jgi:hypothetical protein
MRMRNALLALSVGALLVAPAVAQASSHREAPFVTKNPKVDGTDFYMFNSYETGRTGFVTIIANYQPLQDAYGGPNYFEMDPDALYEIEIDNNGDCVEDYTFQFQFQHALGGTNNAGILLPIGAPDGGGLQQVAVPLVNIGSPNTAAAQNVVETFTVNMVTGPRRTGTVAAVKNATTSATTFTKPTDNIGVKSFGGADGYNTGSIAYPAYAANFVYPITIPNCSTPGKMFVGQRSEPFAVNLGPTFDLIDAPASVVTGGGDPANYAAVPNPLALKNVTSIELELPATCIQTSATDTVLGGWTTASVRQARVINPKASYPLPSKEGGAWAQVSRLGNPLVNEVVIGLPDKDLWNTSEPSGDAQFATYVTNPTLPALIDVVFGVGFQPMVFPRTDLVATFLTGLKGVNQLSTPDGGAPAVCEYLRLNTGLENAVNPGTWATPAGSAQSRFGAAFCAYQSNITPSATGCDLSGFPNGRRPIDDVVDLALDVVEGFLLPAGQAPAFGATPVYFTDGVDQGAVTFDPTFPYLTTPTQGANGDGT